MRSKWGKISLGVCTAAALLTTAALAQLGNPPAGKRHKLAPAHRMPPPLPSSTQLGAPLEGLSPTELADFSRGMEEFQAVETPEGGLGPIFNDSSCVACHTAGAIGGASARTVTRFGRWDGRRFDPLESLGGSLLQAQAIHPDALEKVPAEANVVALRITTPLFGAGLIESISDEDILRNARRRQPDGISGRAHLVLDVATGQTRVGRFGWKAQQASLLAFSGDAYVNEMGVTSRLFPTENAPNGRADLLARFDLVPDVEDTIDPATGKSDIDHAADFMRLLAPPPQKRATAQSMAGERLFEQLNCSACHTPSLNTGPSAVRALAHRNVRLFSDLLLHDMGGLGDGIAQGHAGPREMRTAPLWGLSARPVFLHDGRATTVDAAIRQHAGEGTASRRRYEQMLASQREALLAFLASI